MTRSAPNLPECRTVCKDCGTKWMPLYDTRAELREKARCPECHAQNYTFEE